MEANKERQIEEIEALTSIYEDLFELENENNYTVRIEEGEMKANLSITLNQDYPSNAPPTYSLFAPFLSNTNRQKLTNNLESVYLDNIGESVVFLWIEEIRQYLQNLDSSAGCDNNETCDTVINKQLQDLLISDKSLPFVECPEIYTTDVFEDRKSVFQGHSAVVHNVDEVRAVMNKLKENKKIAHATHNMQAYRIYIQDKNSWLQDCDDDGETAAGSRMLHLLEIVDAKNVLVVVSRWFGGVHLGADRFKHINNMTRRALEESGMLPKDKNDQHNKKKKNK